MKEREEQVEQQLIQRLCHGVSQWTYRPDIKCEEDLWKNLRAKLNTNNLDKLQGVPITDKEMIQVKEFILDKGKSSFFAARWLSGEHGVAQIPLIRDDASPENVLLTVVNSREIAGGSSTYEIINQYESVSPGGRRRRFDVTLLINGLPLIHIELKNADHPYLDAFRQINKYVEEGHFKGIMGLVQMFVVSNVSETRYIAANFRGHTSFMNEKFLIRWVDSENSPVNHYLEFATAALNIPLAHQMIGKYSVLDNDAQRLIILRPYQIHAIEAIKRASGKGHSGYIWHTTGSGKTLTSYNVTKNLLDVPGIDKTIFLIDRKDLDEQTSTSFLSYAKNDDINICGTDNSQELEELLSKKDRCAIIATIQKLQVIIRKCSGSDALERYKKLRKVLRDKRVAFIVDECHRAVTPETKRELEKFFGGSLWFGFTGTPIFEENKREVKGDLAQTTAALYKTPDLDSSKSLLHAYTIKEAIGDNAVLGFNINGLGLCREELEKAAQALECFPGRNIKKVGIVELEKTVPKAYSTKTKKDFYDTDEHKELVINYIVNQSAGRLKLNSPQPQHPYGAILTVGSIQEAQAYYRLFKKFIEEGRVAEKIRAARPDFPRIAITYSVGENEDGAMADQREMQESIEDYNAYFRTNWDLSTISGYNAELNSRLARKLEKFRRREEQVDLVIVVDRLLTGFDAPPISTIFLDRPPMKPQHLIQAFSRTNRIYDEAKRYGEIVTFRTPNLYEKEIDEALRLYSNGGANDVRAPSYEETAAKLRQAIHDFKEFEAVNPDEISSMAVDELKVFIKAYQKVDRMLGQIEVYDEYDETIFEDSTGFTRERFEKLGGYYQNAIERLRGMTEDSGTSDMDLDLAYQLESIKVFEVNFQYLVRLLQEHIPQEELLPKAITEEEDQRIQKYIARYKQSKPMIGSILEEVWKEIKDSPEDFRGQDAFEVLADRVSARIDEEIKAFSEGWGTAFEPTRAYALYTPESEITEKNFNVSLGDFKRYRDAGGAEATMLRYRSELRKNGVKFIKEVIKPLTQF